MLPDKDITLDNEDENAAVERSLTCQFASTGKAEFGYHTARAAGRGRLLSAALVLLTAQIIATLLSSTMAAEVAVGSQFNLNAPGFYELAAPCMDCHAIADDSTDLVGPTLKGVFGRRIASIDSYSYSAALYRKAAVGMSWDEINLDRFLASPQTMAPGSAMTYAGVPDAGDRAQLITWLATGPVALDAEALAAAVREPNPEVKAILQITADAQYGEYLAGKCLTCHLSPGASSSIPPITGLPADYFVNALLEYQQGTRPNPTMRTMSDLLGAEELAALASYFAQPVP